MATLLFLLSLVCLLTITQANEDPPLVKIEEGKLLGKYMKSKSGREFAAFQGIPYAKPPVGKLRFEVKI